MSPLLASTALGLVAAWPVSGLGLGLGRLVERLTPDPRPRAAAWSLAHALPGAALAATVALTLAPTPEVASTADASAHGLAATLSLPATGPGPAPAWRPPPGLTEGLAWGLAILSGAGLVARTARWTVGRRRLARIRAEASVSDDMALVEAVRRQAQRLGVSAPPVRISARIGEPMLVGAFQPTIVLPKAQAETSDTQRLALICGHELAHLRRGDNWRIPVEEALAGLFWLAPPVAVLRQRMLAAREAVCDLAALDGAAPDARRDYARALIEALRANALPAPQSSFTGRQRSLVEMRLSAILQPRQSASPARIALTIALGGVLTVAAGAGSLALAREAKTAKPPQAAPASTAAATPRSGGFDVSADTVWTSSDKTRNTFSGEVAVRGDVNPTAYTVTVNGGPAPAGFRIETLPEGAIQRLEVIDRKATPDGKTALNVILATNP